jgi:hypothetical protein
MHETLHMRKNRSELNSSHPAVQNCSSPQDFFIAVTFAHDEVFQM